MTATIVSCLGKPNMFVGLVTGPIYLLLLGFRRTTAGVVASLRT